ncbi:MAG: N-6 DNA methylase [Chitinophagales bacterium]
MLDTTTKKNIDDCRDVLVGKVPDPKSQIEQITLALIYKFMDDMDKEVVEKFKGKAKFFTGEYAKYGWRKLFDPSLSGQDMLSLYSEALEKLNTNPNIPELFRNIFKNAYLPYRDPSTLKLFLKHINEFEYSHSEKLGDAFEYLLSVMGSQGDAGQFRTPRHIIDFVTACVNPQKNETVLDPACGTAGFLLSAYKHIINYELKITNDELKDTVESEDNVIRNSQFGIKKKKFVTGLTPDERRKLGQNIVGYDISPDMVRLSLANMYLHGFATPQIYEYDTLSSEDRWNETFDVILANPPFMTPKGGIRPHKKFGVQANKAEVLFTDYIAEHLNSNGRAGIVVPNGIVATSQNAYKQLRKLVVEDSLLAVISLPAGVFQPYSGVKTSVLLLDKKLAKKSKHILFLKIENDGFDLGAQRREIDKNDLPLALQILEEYKESLNYDFTDSSDIMAEIEKRIFQKTTPSTNQTKSALSNKQAKPTLSDNQTKSASSNNQTKSVSSDNQTKSVLSDNQTKSVSSDNQAKSASSTNQIKSAIQTIATLVEKQTILANKDIVLSGERYFKNDELKITNYELVKLGEIIELIMGQAPAGNECNKDGIGTPFVKVGQFGEIKPFINEWTTKPLKMAEEGDVLLCVVGATIGKLNLGIECAIGRSVAALRPKKEKLEQIYLYHLLKEWTLELREQSQGSAQGVIGKDIIFNIQIPLPPLEIQQQIVAEIEGYQKIIDGAKQIVNNYKPVINYKLPISNYEMVELEQLCDVRDGTHDSPKYVLENGIPFITQKNITKEGLSFNDVNFISREDHEKIIKRSNAEFGDIIISMIGANRGMSCIIDTNREFSIKNVGLIKPLGKINHTYLLYFLKSTTAQEYINLMSSGGAQQFIGLTTLRKFPIPVPDKTEQIEIVKRIEEEQQLVNANKRLIEIFEQKIKDKISEVWGEN